jgi:hypothetical protein
MSEWFTYPDPRATRLPQDLPKIKEAIKLRQKKYPEHTKCSLDNQIYVDELNKNGVTVVKNVIDPESIHKLLEETEYLMSHGRLTNEYVKPSGTKFVINQEKRRHTHRFISVRHPLTSCPSSVPIGFNDTAIDIATGYLGCLPLVGGSNLRRSYVNKLKANNTQLFHSDGNSAFFIKFFYYLNDVNMKGGPFTYVEGSHRKKFKGWQSKTRWKDKEIIKQYGEDSLRHLTANVGDMIIANTTGFHKGLQPVKRDRFMFTLNFGVHVEGWKPQSHRVFQKDVDKLSEFQKSTTEGLVKF